MREDAQCDRARRSGPKAINKVIGLEAVDGAGRKGERLPSRLAICARSGQRARICSARIAARTGKGGATVAGQMRVGSFAAAGDDTAKHRGLADGLSNLLTGHLRPDAAPASADFCRCTTPGTTARLVAA